MSHVKRPRKHLIKRHKMDQAKLAREVQQGNALRIARRAPAMAAGLRAQIGEKQ